MNSNIKGINLLHSLLIFGIAAILLALETQFLIPFLSKTTGIEPIIFWFLVAGLGLFLPMLSLTYFILKNEGLKIDRRTWEERLRFKKMVVGDWLWSLGAVFIIGALSLGIIKIIEAIIGKVDSSPSFMYFEPLTSGRYWILLAWLPYWLLNIMGEEILWRGVILPKQELAFRKTTWLIHGIFWGIFHIAFGWQLLLTLIPMMFIQSYVVQRRKNSWIGVIIHAVINGPSFIAIAFGLI
ncbi:MAG: CPBP family intramembrane glutamic endopeptidase [Candidatus Zhuqueibacterota bacterium]